MGDARSAVQRPRRFRRRARLRQARISAVPCVVRRQPGHFRRRPGAGAPAVGSGRPHLPPRQALFVRRRAHHAEADPASAADLCRVVLKAFDRACGAVGLRADRGAVRRGDELWRLEAGRRPLSRDLRQARQETAAADVQLFHPFCRQQGAGGRATRAADPLLQGMRDPGAARAIRKPRRRAIAISSTWSTGWAR